MQAVLISCFVNVISHIDTLGSMALDILFEQFYFDLVISANTNRHSAASNNVFFQRNPQQLNELKMLYQKRNQLLVSNTQENDEEEENEDYEEEVDGEEG